MNHRGTLDARDSRYTDQAIYSHDQAKTEVLSFLGFSIRKMVAGDETEGNGIFWSETVVVGVLSGHATVRCFMPRRETYHAPKIPKQAFERS